MSSSGPQWCSSADQSSSLPPAVATMQRFDIKMMLIVHYSKIQGLNKHIYTCRALGDGGQSITASKTYEQYLDLSWRLSEAFPHISQKHLPRLHKKSALFVTRSTLLQRKEDLDIWVRRIASIPEVRSSKPLLDFLHDDNWGQPPTVDLKQRPVASSSYSHPRPSLTLGQSTPSPSPRRAEFAAKELPPLPSSAAGRPALAHKRSTPNLRSRPDFLEFDAPPTPAPPLHFQSGGRKSPAAAPSVLSLASRPSMDSVARSVSTDHTVTPASIQASLSRATSPSSPPAPSPASSDTLKANSLRGSKPTLRNFTSLQDLRQTAAKPHPPVFPKHLQEEKPHMFRSTSSNTSIAAICGHPSLIERKRPSSHISTRSYNSQRSCESTHRQTNSGSSLRSLQSHTHSSASISSLSDAVGHHDSFRKTMNTSYSSSSNDDYSLTFDSGPGSPASLPLPQTPPSPPPYFQSLPLSHVKSSENDDWMSSVLRPSLMSLPADCTSVGNQPRRPRTSSTNSKRGQPLDSPQMQGVLSSYDQNFPDLSVSSASSSPHSAPEGTIILKVKHNAEIVMVKVARSAPLEEVKQAVVERFRSHNIRLDPAWLQLSKSNGPASRKPDRHRDVTPLQTDAAWLAASASAVKLTILC